MSPTPERPFSRADFYPLLAATLAGVAWACFTWPSQIHMYGWDLMFLGNRRGFQVLWGHRGMVLGAIRVALRLLSDFCAPLTLAVLVIRLRRPRPGFGQPGVVACAAASAVLLAEVASYPFNLITLFDELTRLQGSFRSNVVNYPRMREGSTIVGSIGSMVGEHPGLAVAGVFLGFWAAGLRGAGPSWVDRLGRALGLFWIVAALGFMAVPIWVP
jgi:hypothetical protein